MKYKITNQYARGAENPLAEFVEINDANFFIERKILADKERGELLIYRLFENYTLLKEFNKEKTTTRIDYAQYAEGDNYFPASLQPFKVCKEKSSTSAIAAFIQKNDAELFVEDKITQTDEITTYFIYEKDALIIEMNQRVKKQSLSEDSSQGQGKAASFRPTPLNTSPRPPGTPPTWVKDEDDENK